MTRWTANPRFGVLSLLSPNKRKTIQIHLFKSTRLCIKVNKRRDKFSEKSDRRQSFSLKGFLFCASFLVPNCFEQKIWVKKYFREGTCFTVASNGMVRLLDRVTPPSISFSSSKKKCCSWSIDSWKRWILRLCVSSLWLRSRWSWEEKPPATRPRQNLKKTCGGRLFQETLPYTISLVFPSDEFSSLNSKMYFVMIALMYARAKVHQSASPPKEK